MTITETELTPTQQQSFVHEWEEARPLQGLPPLNRSRFDDRTAGMTPDVAERVRRVEQLLTAAENATASLKRFEVQNRIKDLRERDAEALGEALLNDDGKTPPSQVDKAAGKRAKLFVAATDAIRVAMVAQDQLKRELEQGRDQRQAALMRDVEDAFDATGDLIRDAIESALQPLVARVAAEQQLRYRAGNYRRVAPVDAFTQPLLVGWQSSQNALRDAIR